VIYYWVKGAGKFAVEKGAILGVSFSVQRAGRREKVKTYRQEKCGWQGIK
jgi:hypothetical protein